MTGGGRRQPLVAEPFSSYPNQADHAYGRPSGRGDVAAVLDCAARPGAF